ncbi:MAG TPA: hypothetical protein VJH71_01570 [Candidatus Paceibacterota bacterium]
MPEQLEIIDTKNEGDESILRSRWDKSSGFWKSPVFKTEKEHACAKCGNTLPIGSALHKSVTFDGVRPTQDDFKNRIEYWHPHGRCPK